MTVTITMPKQERVSHNPFRPERLRAARLRRNMTQDDVQRALGIGAVQLNRYENGKSRPLPDVLVGLAELLEVSTDYLLGLTDAPNASLSTSDLSADEREVLQAYRDNNMDTLLQKALERSRKKRGD